MKDWSGKDLCFECAKKLGADINIGRHFKGRCHRCHSEQTLFKVRRVPVASLTGEELCPECAHPLGAHAAHCRRSERQLLKELEEIVGVLEEFESYDPQKSLVDQLREVLRNRKG
jgi:protein-arginine kinase activator protein McsA